MLPNATRLLQFHKHRPTVATFALKEMAMEGLSLGDVDAAYQELQDAGFVEPSGQFAMVQPMISRRTYKITQRGLDAQPIRGT